MIASRAAQRLACGVVRATAQRRGVRVNPYVDIPNDFDHPEYWPAIIDQTKPFAGAPGVHWNHSGLPHNYDIYFGTGEHEVPIFDIHSHGHQTGTREALLAVLRTAGYLFLMYHLMQWTQPWHPWFTRENIGPATEPNHYNYLHLGGNPEDPWYKAQLEKEKALLLKGKAIALGY
eukprot:NODE_8443_length_701_cov_139.634948_g8187_i0.p1 GENE.NODE_8443_length_701_cov_139.634948_g8187_i0~~NODE_8443_length_701_cov_139.634948_g8187_i0.p1  ORF type:complete len:193 (-),score=45.87 NODE_8443_length_701_cov_139.634948_g8187_i0:121-645(-)